MYAQVRSRCMYVVRLIVNRLRFENKLCSFCCEARVAERGQHEQGWTHQWVERSTQLMIS